MSRESRDTDTESSPSTHPNGGTVPQQAPTEGANQPAYGDLVTSPLTKRFAKFSAVVYAAVAVSLGVMFQALKVLGKPPVTGEQTADSAEVAATIFLNESVGFAIVTLPLLATALAVVVGLYAARELDVSDRELFTAASVGSMVGAFVLVVVGSFLLAAAFGNVEGSRVASKPGTIEFGNLLFNAVAVSIGAGLLAYGTAWADRTFA